jgi:hypothetical protein
MMRTKFLKIPVALLAIALFAAGCGASDDSSSLTKAQLIAKADEICAKADKAQLKGLAEAAETKSIDQRDTTEQEALVVSKGLPPIQKEAEEIRALGAPAGTEDEIEAIVDGIEKAVDRAEEKPSSIEKATGTPFDGVDKLAAEFGFKACSQAL